MTAETATREPIGRLALRHEGEMWNAYYAEVGTMEDAILLGSIRIDFVIVEAFKVRFMTLMQNLVGELVRNATGHTPTWGPPEAGPESERAGHA